MPNSLKVKLSKLRYKGEITQEEYSELIKKLDGHDEQIRAKTIDEFKEKMCNLNQLNCFMDYIADEIDLEELMKYASEEIAEQMKGVQK